MGSWIFIQKFKLGLEFPLKVRILWHPYRWTIIDFEFIKPEKTGRNAHHWSISLPEKRNSTYWIKLLLDTMGMQLLELSFGSKIL